MQVDECAGALIRAVSRAEEDLAPCLPPKSRAYLFGSLGFAAARTIMWLLPELGVSPPLKSLHLSQSSPLGSETGHSRSAAHVGFIYQRIV